jgi:hypothetical protein
MAGDPGYFQPPAAPQQHPLDPGVWPIIRQSAAQLARDEEAFIRQLHYDVTRLIPRSAVPPGLDMRAFCGRMAQTLLWAARTDQRLTVVVDTLRQTGAQNWFEGFPDAQYPSMAHALVQAVQYRSGNNWSTSTGSAWISFFMWVQPHLLTGAQQAAVQDAAAREAAARDATAQRAAAEWEAARVERLSRDSQGGHTQVVGDVNLERVAPLLDEDDDDDGVGQIMVNMTRNRLQRPPPQLPDLSSSIVSIPI